MRIRHLTGGQVALGNLSRRFASAGYDRYDRYVQNVRPLPAVTVWVVHFIQAFMNTHDFMGLGYSLFMIKAVSCIHTHESESCPLLEPYIHLLFALPPRHLLT